MNDPGGQIVMVVARMWMGQMAMVARPFSTISRIGLKEKNTILSACVPWQNSGDVGLSIVLPLLLAATEFLGLDVIAQQCQFVLLCFREQKTKS